MNQLTALVLAAFAAVVFGFAWDYTRQQLADARREINLLEATRAADNEALSRIQRERDQIAREYEALARELTEITDAPAVDYLNAPVPDSIRRLLER